MVRLHPVNLLADLLVCWNDSRKSPQTYQHEEGLREAIKTFLESAGRTQLYKITGNNGIKSDSIPRDEENFPLEYDGHGTFTGLARLICGLASSAEIAKSLCEPDNKFSDKEIGTLFHPNPKGRENR